MFDVIWSSYFHYITTITTTTTMTITCMVSLLLLLLLFLYNCRVNPVTGRYEPPRPSPLEGMTDEQKEHEAMKLVNVLDKLTRYAFFGVRASSCACVCACVHFQLSLYPEKPFFLFVSSCLSFLFGVPF